MYYALTKADTADLEDIHMHANCRQDPMVYHLVYGVMHTAYGHVANHLLNGILRKRHTIATMGKKTAYDIALVSEGEIELMVYIGSL